MCEIDGLMLMLLAGCTPSTFVHNTVLYRLPLYHTTASRWWQSSHPEEKCASLVRPICRAKLHVNVVQFILLITHNSSLTRCETLQVSHQLSEVPEAVVPLCHFPRWSYCVGMCDYQPTILDYSLVQLFLLVNDPIECPLLLTTAPWTRLPPGLPLSTDVSWLKWPCPRNHTVQPCMDQGQGCRRVQFQLYRITSLFGMLCVEGTSTTLCMCCVHAFDWPKPMTFQCRHIKGGSNIIWDDRGGIEHVDKFPREPISHSSNFLCSFTARNISMG